MSEKPLDRLNYYNGKRLVAADLKLEQEYHIRVRRWLNKSLYSAGIARGLEVREEKGKPAVVVGPGLALDADGREIILLDEVRLEVRGGTSGNPCGGKPGNGSYLTIAYDEEVAEEESDGCCPPAARRTHGDRVAWGGPGRVRAEPILSWTDVLPAEGSGEVVLAQVWLDAGCTSVRRVDVGVRRYIGAASAAKVRQYALEGHRDVDVRNPQRIYFHVRGRQPSAVTLYLRATQFPSYFYTELGRHDHTITVNVHSATIPAHSHTLSGATGEATAHSHVVSSVTADTDDSVWGGLTAILAATNPVSAIPLAGLFVDALVEPQRVLTLSPRPFHNHDGDNITARVRMSVTVDDEAAPRHTHPMPAATDSYPADGSGVPIQLSGDASSQTAGVNDPAYTAHGGAPLKFVRDLHVKIDGVDQTANIQSQLRASFPTEDAKWTLIGDGTSTHPMAHPDTEPRPIKLDFLPDTFFGEGEHWIELSAPELTDAQGAKVPNGGRVLYNLYVE